MKTKLMLGLFLVASNLTFSQKLTKENLKKYEFEFPPQEMTFQEYDKYAVSAKCLWNEAGIINQVLIASKLRGFTKTTNRAEAGFVLSYTVNNITFSQPSYTTSKTTREKDGVKTVTTHHDYKGNCSYNVELSVFDQSGKLLFSDVEIGNERVWGTSTSSKSDAYTKYSNKRKSLRSSVTKKAVNKIEARFAQKYCYVPYRVQVKGVKVKPKKYDYDEFNMAVDYVKMALNRSSLASRVELLEPAIKNWEKDLEQADEIAKKARVNTKVMSAAFYNIGMANFLMNRFELARQNFQKARDYNKTVTNNVVEMINVCKKMEERKENIRPEEI